MSKKDYEFLASTMLACKPSGVATPPIARALRKQWETTVTILADRLACFPRFDRERFLAACGM